MGAVTGSALRPSAAKVLALCAAVVAAACGVLAFLLVAAPSPAGATGLLLNGTATASSQEGPAFAAANARDADPSTRWSSAFADDQWLQVDLRGITKINEVGLHWETAYAKTYKIQLSDDGVRFRDVTGVLAGVAGYQLIPLEHYGRYVRILGLTRATDWGFSLREVHLAAFYTPPMGRCDVPEAATRKPALASSTEGAATPASAAVDGPGPTRWSSEFTDEQWIQVDLGREQQVCHIWLDWEAAYAGTFEVQGSLDGVTFVGISPVLTGQHGLQSAGLRGTWRYVRVQGLTRATQYGYSLYDIRILGSSSSTQTPPPASAR